MKHNILALVALTITATAATTETYNLSAGVNQTVTIPRAKAGLVRVDVAFKVTVNGILTVTNPGAPYAGNADLTLAYSAGQFGMSQSFGAWQTWPNGVTTVNGFGFTDSKNNYYVTGLAAWQTQSSFTCNANAVATGGVGTIAASSGYTLSVTYTYDPLPAVSPKKK